MKRYRLRPRSWPILGGWLVLLLGVACAPKISVQAPEKPIVINLNIKIEHEIRVKVDEDLEDLFDADDGLF